MTKKFNWWDSVMNVKTRKKGFLHSTTTIYSTPIIKYFFITNKSREIYSKETIKEFEKKLIRITLDNIKHCRILLTEKI